MRSACDSQIPNGDSPAASAEVRRHSRFRVNMLASTIGEVIDISEAGLRVAHRGSPRVGVGESVSFTLSLASSEVSVQGRIVWMRRTGFRRHEIGVEFYGLDDETRTCLGEIARCAARLAGSRPRAA